MTSDLKTIMAIGTEYPCCEKHLRFVGNEEDRPKITRYCRSCDIHWVIFREPGPLDEGPIRVDKLHWEVDV